jgi:hypothetical protein
MEVNNGLWVVLLYASYYVILEPFAGVTWLLTHGLGCYAAATALRQVRCARPAPKSRITGPFRDARRHFLLHDGTRYRGLHVRRWGLGFVHRFKDHVLSPRAKP